MTQEQKIEKLKDHAKTGGTIINGMCSGVIETPKGSHGIWTTSPLEFSDGTQGCVVQDVYEGCSDKALYFITDANGKFRHVKGNV